ncbi:nucleoside-binding protein [Jatrophihabitans sp. GAS493]|uniref:BMP family lipoprotein n=1 Tax=Jatrophihabitans sp. GAS493 TaxID=1907575 RepID=UPI000BBFFE74|nr:BMP family ABC transporter substrate-binding protein [Jatrophihabitans sp. GAS493]SOD71976.1 nucleoside-binding protein [Jatrophihabitans sp. GAS493]
MRSTRSVSKGALKLGAFALVAALTISACSSSKSSSSSSGTSAAKKSIKVGMAYDVGGRGDKSFNDLAAAGLDKAKTDLDVQTKELSATNGENDQAKEDRLTLLATSGYNPIIAVGFAYATAVGKVIAKYPNIHFALIDDDSVKGPNLTSLLFTEEQSSFLVGVAAALATKTKTVGFIGGVQEPLIQKFQAGYQAGVKAVDPSIKVLVAYLTQPPDFSGFGDAAKGKTTAEGQYDGGADVVYHAAGGSGAGVFQAAAEKQKLAIGVDSDQYQSAPADEQKLILTSALKGVDTAVYDFIENDANGKFTAGSQRFSLKDNGVGYSTSNPIIDPYKAQIDAYKAKIISGEITVPTTVS